ncbi:hypothetical protein [Sporosarcina trichiuri]|uniref:hypothetical protein n=1 Tax=Sporosarcina trichiuri TaxID=3056445 RepID=UPI0025B30B41|nr:hypothetical protein [Sporosarcina sp. 0.2-SM1T-5]WJY26357.1 hypothetical protein QWT68_09700 [Sporosarcina sp. 0.2-SM1T-5]
MSGFLRGQGVYWKWRGAAHRDAATGNEPQASTNQGVELCADADKFGEVSDNSREVSDTSAELSDTSCRVSDTSRNMSVIASEGDAAADLILSSEPLFIQWVEVIVRTLAYTG